MEGFIAVNSGLVGRLSLLAMGGIIILIIVMGNLIKYPDIIKTSGRLYGEKTTRDSIYIEIDMLYKNAIQLEPGTAIQFKLDEYEAKEPETISGFLQHVNYTNKYNDVMAQVVVPDRLSKDLYELILTRNGMKGDLLIIGKEVPLLRRILSVSKQTSNKNYR